MGKIRVEELAAQMGIGSKEVLFLLQSIGVDVKSPQAALDESTVLAILQGKTHAPKQLIVRDTEARAPRPQKSALSRIKIVEKPPAGAGEVEAEEPAPPRRASERASRAAHPPEPARTAVVPSEPEAPAPPPAPSAPPPAAAAVVPVPAAAATAVAAAATAVSTPPATPPAAAAPAASSAPAVSPAPAAGSRMTPPPAAVVLGPDGKPVPRRIVLP